MEFSVHRYSPFIFRCTLIRRGVSNAQLCKENKELASAYDEKSVAEQNSLDLAWDALMDPNFQDLRNCIYTTPAELKRFRQLLVQTVLATDIFDKELSALRKKRWARAFQVDEQYETQTDVNRKATIVIEHLIQASDVAHTMQHWQEYLKWNGKLGRVKKTFIVFMSQIAHNLSIPCHRRAPLP